MAICLRRSWIAARVKLARALTITAQVLLGVTFGFIGILLASPLTATAMILVRMIYLEDLLAARGGKAEPEKSDSDQPA